MTEQMMTTKQTYLAYLRGEVSFETVEQSASETLQKYRGIRKSSEDAEGN